MVCISERVKIETEGKSFAHYTSANCISCCIFYKDRAAPPIGGTALHDGGVKTVQWTKREGHDSYQEVEVYIYKYI